MAFWGVEVKAGKPFTLVSTENTKRLHLSQATLGIGNATTRSILQCNVGSKSPLFLCVLSPEKVDSCQLNLEFEEADPVVFSVIGPRTVHLTGYFLPRSTSFRQNDDESESFGEDIVDTDVEKASSDDYDYSDSFINDDEPSARGSHVSTTDDDEISIKEMASKTKDKKRNGKGRRLRKKFLVSDSESDETSARVDDSCSGDSVEVLDKPKSAPSEVNLAGQGLQALGEGDKCKIPKVLSSENSLPSRVTRSKARSSTLENGEPSAKLEKALETRTHTHTPEKKEDKPLGEVEKSCETPSKKKRKERSKNSVVINSDVKEGNTIPESLQNEKPATDKVIKSSSDVLPSQNGDEKVSKKKRKRDRREEDKDGKKNPSESKAKKQENNEDTTKEAGSKKPLESKVLSNGMIIEKLENGEVDGKAAVTGKRVSILYTGKLRDTEKVFDSNLGEAPLKFRLGGKKVIEGLSIGVEGMRVGDKRKITIPPSLGYSEEGLKDSVPKNAWLVYEVEAVKIK